MKRFLFNHLRNSIVVAAGVALVLSVAAAPASAQPAVKPVPQQFNQMQWDDRSVYAFLAAELLSLDGDFEQAALALWPLARQVKQVELYERVTLWAMQAKRYDILFSAASAWEQQDPAAKPPKNFLEFLLIALRFDRMEQLRKAGKPDEAREQLLAAYAARARISSVETALMLAEHLEDDYLLDRALTVYAYAASLSDVKNVERTQLIRAKILALKARRGDSGSLAELLNAQKIKTGAEKQMYTGFAIGLLREAQDYAQTLELIKSLPADEQNYENALTYELMGQYEKAEMLLREALKKAPRAAHLLNTLGYSLVDRNPNPATLAEGTALLEAAYSAAPNSSAIMDSLGWAYFRNKDYVKAQVLLQKSYDLRRDPEVAAHLGELLHVTGKTEQARKLWEQALAIDPKHKVLNNTLKRLGIAP